MPTSVVPNCLSLHRSKVRRWCGCLTGRPDCAAGAPAVGVGGSRSGLVDSVLPACLPDRPAGPELIEQRGRNLVGPAVVWDRAGL